MSLIWAFLLLPCVGLAIAGVLRLGWLWGRRRLRIHGEHANEGLGTLDAAVFGMMGLLIAFTFTGAAGRFDERRALIGAEVNALGTAWLRLDMLPQPARAEIQGLFREYLDGRIAAYRVVDRDQALLQLTEHSDQMQGRIWERLMTALRENPSVAPLVLLPPVNEAFDLATTRLLATRQHPPRAIYLMLVTMVLVSGFLAGFGQAKASRQSLLHVAGFAVTTTLALYLIVDLEYPRLGLVRIDSFDQALVELRAAWN